MSLVTVQRSLSGTGSHNSLSDDDTNEGNKRLEKSECFFTGKGSALILALREIPHHIAERRKSLDSEKCSGSISCANLDIQHHLQSIFYLLRHEDTLKMAVKLESQRPNRTRYLAIVSRPCYKKNNGLNISSGSRLLVSRKSKKSTYQRDNEQQQQQEQTYNENKDNKNIEITSMTLPDVIDKRTQQQQQQQLEQNNRNISEEGSSSTPSSSSLLSSTATTVIDIQQEQQQQMKCSSSNSSSTTKRSSIICDIPVYGTSSSSRTDNVELEESCLLGIDCNEKTTIGLVLKVLADTTIRLDGDGGFSISVYGKTHIFKPVSVQAMWSALQTLHKVSQKARDSNFYPGGPSHEWVSYYENRIESDRSCLNEWNTMDSLESRRPPSPDAIENKPTKREETKQVIRMKLKEILMSVDLDEVTSKYIRGRLEEHLKMDLGEYKSFIDEEMITILGQMDAPTEIFEHVYLGSEWNASNLDELQKNGVRHILNVTREIDNFFPGMFDYFNVRVYDDEKTNLLKHWDNTFKYISRAKAEGSKVLVHCKMGVSRSASVVIAYAMKEYNWDFDYAFQHVKEKRTCVKPNKSFLAQLETYRGMLDAMQNKEKLQRSKSETNLKATKDARLLPGSEPTPLIQALNNSQKTEPIHGSEQEYLSSPSSPSSRSLSSSSTNFRSTTIKRSNSSLTKNFDTLSPTSPIGSSNSMTISKQQSVSLEDVFTVHHNDQKNVRYPGTNGQNYSVTQNQILHIQKNNNNSSIEKIVSELETEKSETEKMIVGEEDNNIICKSSVNLVNQNKEDNNHDTIMLSTSSSSSLVSPSSGGENLIWTSSSQLIRQSTNIDMAAKKSHNTLVDSMDESQNEFQNQQEQQQQQQQQKQLHSEISTIPITVTGSPISPTTTSSTTGVTTNQDYFSSQLDNIFENEETRTGTGGGGGGGSVSSVGSGNNNSKFSATNPVWTTTNPILSRQSSCSSVDSAVFVGGYSSELTDHHPSRQSSWGSGDNRVLPSRNSSWGSYDTNKSSSTLNAFRSLRQLKKYDPDYNVSGKGERGDGEAGDEKVDVISSTTIGTVKRTKQKLEENSSSFKKYCGNDRIDTNQSCQNIAITTAAANFNVTTAAATVTVAYTADNVATNTAINTANMNFLSSNQPILVSNKIESQQKMNRDDSEDIVMLRNKNQTENFERKDEQKTRKNRDSKLKKEEEIGTSNIEKLEKLSVSAPEAFSIEKLANVIHQQAKKKKQTIKDSYRIESSSSASHVQNLKKNFEAKASVAVSNFSKDKGHQSLPSSPIASHSGNKDLNVKDLVIKYQTSDPLQQQQQKQQQQQQQHHHHQQRQHHTALSNRIRPRSFYESRTMYMNSSNISSSSSSNSSNSSGSSGSDVERTSLKFLRNKKDSINSNNNSSTSSINTRTGNVLSITNTSTVEQQSKHEKHQHQHQQQQQQQKFNNEINRPPPVPPINKFPITDHNTSMTDSILSDNFHQRKVQHYGKTHPLARLSFCKKKLNAATYNTM